MKASISKARKTIAISTLALAVVAVAAVAVISYGNQSTPVEANSPPLTAFSWDDSRVDTFYYEYDSNEGRLVKKTDVDFNDDDGGNYQMAIKEENPYTPGMNVNWKFEPTHKPACASASNDPPRYNRNFFLSAQARDFGFKAAKGRVHGRITIPKTNGEYDYRPTRKAHRTAYWKMFAGWMIGSGKDSNGDSCLFVIGTSLWVKDSNAARSATATPRPRATATPRPAASDAQYRDCEPKTMHRYRYTPSNGGNPWWSTGWHWHTAQGRDKGCHQHMSRDQTSDDTVQTKERHRH